MRQSTINLSLNCEVRFAADCSSYDPRTPLLRISSKKALEKSDIWIAPDYNRAGRVTTETQELYEKYKVLELTLVYSCDLMIR